MRLLGILVLAAGIAVGLFGLAMDTSVDEGRAGKQRGYMRMRDAVAEEEATDAALAGKQKMWLWVGGFLAVAGLAIAVVGDGGRQGEGSVAGNIGADEGDDEWMVEHELTKKKKGAPQQPALLTNPYREEEEEDAEEEEEYMEEEEEGEQDEKDNVHSITETLIKLNELRKEGVLTDEEFNEQKAKLLRKR